MRMVDIKTPRTLATSLRVKVAAKSPAPAWEVGQEKLGSHAQAGRAMACLYGEGRAAVNGQLRQWAMNLSAFAGVVASAFACAVAMHKTAN